MARETAVDLYLVQRQNTPIGRDEVAGFVIAAVTFQQARKIAADHAQDEGKAVWLDVDRSRCEKLAKDVHRKSGVVLSDIIEG